MFINKKIFFSICLLFLLTNWEIKAQSDEYIQGHKRKIIRKASKLYKGYYYYSANHIFKKIHEVDTVNSFVQLELARTFLHINQPKEAAYWYSKVISNEKHVTLDDKFNYAQMLLSCGKLEDAKNYFQLYHKEDPSDRRSLKKIKGIDHISKFLEDSLSLKVEQPNINSPEGDFGPVFYNDGLVFVSTRTNTHPNSYQHLWNNSMFQDLYYSHLNKDSTLSDPLPFDELNNIALHEGDIAFFDNGKKLIFTRHNYFNGILKRKDPKLNNLKLFFADKIKHNAGKENWENISIFPYNSDKYSIGQPSISSKGVLYFVSDNPGGLGGTDIYQCLYIDGNWSAPENLGREINTEGNEFFPFIYNDSILYFTSDGHEGIGGLDIYKAINRDGTFSNVENLGAPINSPFDDFSFIKHEKENFGFFSSNRKNGTDDSDIYKYSPATVSINGTILDNLNGTSLSNAEIALWAGNQKQETILSDEKGEFSFKLRCGKKYLLEVKHKDFVATKEEIFPKNLKSLNPIKKEFSLIKLRRIFIYGFLEEKDFVGKLNEIKTTLIDKSSGREKPIQIDDKGEFTIEIDEKKEYVLLIENGTQSYTTHFYPHNTAKASFIHYIYPKMQVNETLKISGVVKNQSNKLPIENVLVVAKNKVTERKDSIQTDNSGKFSFTAFSNVEYILTVHINDKTYEHVINAKNNSKPFQIFIPIEKLKKKI